MNNNPLVFFPEKIINLIKVQLLIHPQQTIKTLQTRFYLLPTKRLVVVVAMLTAILTTLHQQIKTLVVTLIHPPTATRQTISRQQIQINKWQHRTQILPLVMVIFLNYYVLLI